MKEKMIVNFSGGRTSGYMTKMLLDNYSHLYEFIVVFANTGMEHPKTLEFVNNCDKYFGFGTIWIEADVVHEKNKGTKYKIVTYETCSRNGEPFEEVIKKYGIPNIKYPHCTRELKLQPINAYIRSLGLDVNKVKTAMGIRTDEVRRVAKSGEKREIVYPLIDMFPSDKQDVLDWWEDQEFDLGLSEWDGNCKLCYKKSTNKLFKQLDSNPEFIEWHKRMEELYGGNGFKKDEDYRRVFFRKNISASQLEQLHKDDRNNSAYAQREFQDFYADGGCSESCEFLPVE